MGTFRGAHSSCRVVLCGVARLTAQEFVLVRARVACCLALPLVTFVACGGPEADPTESLAVLDRLAFVPPGECRLPGREGVDLVCANAEALLVERLEVSRGAWSSWSATSAGAAAMAEDSNRAAVADAWPEAVDSWPASGLTFEEARAYAAAHGMRLPTAREWIRIAAGTRAQPFPWGLARASAVANTVELGLGRPVPTGTFEQGASPDSVYDLLGNVAEWVEDPIASVVGGESDVRPLAWAMGGSFATRLWRIHEPDGSGRTTVVQVDLDPGTRSADVGLRCVADARVWLAVHAPDLGATQRERDGLRRIGARWGRDAIKLLEDLAGRPGAKLSLRWLLEGARG